MKANKGYKYRIYPNKKQQELIDKTIDTCRFLYNKMLSDKIDWYHEDKTMLLNQPAMYKDFYEFLKDVDSLALASVYTNLNIAYSNFFRNLRKGKVTFPKFKSKRKSKLSYTTYYSHNNIRIENNKIKLPKLGFINIVLNRDIEGDIKSVTVTKTRTNKYFVSVLCEYENQVLEKELSEVNVMVGLDYSSPSFFISSDGEVADMPHFFRKSEEKLAKEQRKLSRKKKGGKNREKQRLKVALCYEKITNKRRDWLHNKSTEMANTYDVIFLEDINLQNISQCLKLGKATHDNSFGYFKRFLEYKLEDRGKHLVYIDKFAPSSKLCSKCGYKNKELKLSDRSWICPNCGITHDRDFNAATNILQMGKEIIFGG
jgi:putative transposase